MDNKGESILGVIGMVIFLAVAFGLIANEVMSCDGTVVRGLFWYECIKEW